MVNNVKRIIAFYRLLRPSRLALVFAGGFLVSIPILLGFVYPLVVKRIIDSVTNLRSMDLAGIWILGALYLVSLVSSYAGELIYNRNKYLAAQELRDQIFRESSYLAISSVKAKGGGYFAKLIGDQVNEAFVVLDYAFMRNIFLLLRMVAVLGIIFVWSKVVFFVFTVNVILVLSYSSLMDRATHAYWSGLAEYVRKINGFVVETFENLHELLAGQATERRSEKHSKLLTKITGLALRAENIRATLDKAMVDAPTLASQVLILVYCGFAIIRGQMSVGTLVAMWTYFEYATAPIYVFRDMSRLAVQSAATIESVLEHLSTVRCSSASLKERAIAPMTGAFYDLEDVTVQYGNERVLDGLSLTISEGELVGIIGVSGEGKSTLLSILLGFEKKFTGEARLLGNDITVLRPQDTFDIVGYYAQNVSVFNETLEENIVMGRPVDSERLKGLIEEMELQHLRNRQLGEAGGFISAGEKQRLQLARLIYANKDLVVIDEPLTNLDTVSEKRLLQKLSDHLRGKSGIIVSHKPSVLQLATKVAVMHQGRIVAVGPLQELIKTNDLCKQIIGTYIEMAKEIDQNLREAN